MGNKKLQIWLPLLFALVLIAGMLIGYKLNKNNQNASGFFAGNSRNSLQQVLDLIQKRYVDSIDIDSLEGTAIQGIMSDLDPHSVYFPPANLLAANEELAGNFDGIGVEFNVFADTVNVLYVIPDGPSDKAGVQIGDKIISVNGHSLTRKSITTDSIKNYIRGNSGSVANLSILRNQKKISIDITRGSIPVPSIDAAYMIDKTTGYIKLNKFTETSYEEFMKAMEQLKKQGLQNLIYDLRGNGGGFMNEAVDMADEFLDGNKLIVYTEGVNSSKKEYRCKRPGIFEKGKLVILVDELSASASEILAGALQDWCRATIIGRRTFGKGLVQEQYSLDDGAAIRLTVARYYTPLGRCIQRSYKNGKKVYMDELWERYKNGELISLDSNKLHPDSKKFISGCHDTLYGGEGIIPNIFVPIDTTLSQRNMLKLFNSVNFSSIVYQYYLQHTTALDNYSSVSQFKKTFNSTALWNAFTIAAKKAGVTQFTAKEKAALQERLLALLARYKWRNDGYFEVVNSSDATIEEALQKLEN
ncbi:MAG: S41 family peptidase [Chitinophagaceae bacterium]|nr:S41 family peptidase [Chitinophagaceae bacterium]